MSQKAEFPNLSTICKLMMETLVTTMILMGSMLCRTAKVVIMVTLGWRVQTLEALPSTTSMISIASHELETHMTV